MTNLRTKFIFTISLGKICFIRKDKVRIESSDSKTIFYLSYSSFVCFKLTLSLQFDLSISLSARSVSDLYDPFLRYFRRQPSDQTLFSC